MQTYYLKSIRLFLLVLYTERTISVRTSKNPNFNSGQVELLRKADSSDQLLLEQAVFRLLDKLGARSKLVMMMVCGISEEPQTYEAVGKKLGLAKENIRQICRKAFIQCFYVANRAELDKILFGQESAKVTLDTPLANIQWSGTTRTFIRSCGAITIGDLAKYTGKQIRERRHGGDKTFNEIVETLQRSGFYLEGMDPNSRHICTLHLSVRAENILGEMGIRTIEELCQKTEMEFLRQRNFGKKTLREIKEKLAESGLSLGMRL